MSMRLFLASTILFSQIYFSKLIELVTSEENETGYFCGMTQMYWRRKKEENLFIIEFNVLIGWEKVNGDRLL